MKIPHKLLDVALEDVFVSVYLNFWQREGGSLEKCLIDLVCDMSKRHQEIMKQLVLMKQTEQPTYVLQTGERLVSAAVTATGDGDAVRSGEST